MQVEKIRKLLNTDNFLQLSFKGGYKYIDNAGAVLNKFEESMSGYSMDPNRLVIRFQDQAPKELRVSVGDFWCHFEDDEVLSDTHSKGLASAFVKHAKDVLEVTDVEVAQRFGWRTYLVADVSQKLEALDNKKTTEFTRHLKFGEVEARVLVQILNSRSDPTKSAVLFDVDMYKEASISVSTVQNSVEEVRKTLMSRALLDVVNDVLKGLK